MKKYAVKLLAIFMILILVSSNTMIYGASKSSLNSDLNQTNEDINKTKGEIKEVQKDMSEARKQINNLNVEIAEYENEIEQLDDKLKELGTSIEVQTENLEIEEKNYKKQEDLFHQRLIVLYESGETSYIDVLFGSENITEFLSYYYMMAEIAEADMEMLKNIETKKQEIAIKKQTLENAKDQIEATKKSKEQSAKALAAAKATKNKQMAELSETERALQEELEIFEQHKKEVQAELKRIAEEEAKKNQVNVSNNPSKAGYISPIAGRTKKDITTRYGKGGYSWGGFHTGVDFARNSKGAVQGLPIRAVKDGTVVTSVAYKKNGKYVSYGEYIVINHHDGTMTLYAHGEPGSRKVSVGDKVKQGQTIMNVGTTGNSTGYHLHFEVRVNGSYVDPTPYLP